MLNYLGTCYLRTNSLLHFSDLCLLEQSLDGHRQVILSQKLLGQKKRPREQQARGVFEFANLTKATSSSDWLGAC
jgi:hypothetical protein